MDPSRPRGLAPPATRPPAPRRLSFDDACPTCAPAGGDSCASTPPPLKTTTSGACLLSLSCTESRRAAVLGCRMGSISCAEDHHVSLSALPSADSAGDSPPMGSIRCARAGDSPPKAVHFKAGTCLDDRHASSDSLSLKRHAWLGCSGCSGCNRLAQDL